VRFVIEIPEKVSLNRIYAGIHFRERSEHKEDWHYAVMEAKIPKYKGSYPVEMHYHFRVNGSQLDISNHAYMLKMCEDALVHNKIITDDTQEYISKVSITAQKQKKGLPDVVEVEIIEKINI